MKTLGWWILACVGAACLVAAYRIDRPSFDGTPFSTGVICVSKSDSNPKGPPLPYPSTIARLRLLPAAGFPAMIVQSISASDAKRGEAIERQTSERAFELSFADIDMTAGELAAGRLPQAGKDEAIAGDGAAHRDQFQISGRTFTVVGQLRRESEIFKRSYLIPRDKSVDGLFDPRDAAVHRTVLVSLTPEQLGDRSIRKQLESHFPATQFNTLQPSVRMRPGPFYAFLLGQALLCLGGSGGLIGFYAAAARRVRWRVLQDPFAEMAKRSGLLWGLHLAFFGLCFFAAAIIYQAPDVQAVGDAVIRGQIASGNGPLGFAGTAYATRSIPLAALVTFLINFLLGSIAYITLPSLLIPCSGAFLVAFRAAMVGLLLAPTSRILGNTMLLHSGTLLLEMEGYILATFFGLMVPIFLLRGEPGSTFLGRYRRAFVLNLRGNVLVALVLAIAALYEASEVIARMP